MVIDICDSGSHFWFQFISLNRNVFKCTSQMLSVIQLLITIPLSTATFDANSLRKNIQFSYILIGL